MTINRRSLFLGTAAAAMLAALPASAATTLAMHSHLPMEGNSAICSI